MTFSIGYSPCPNDTFIFDALVHGQIDTQGITFKPVLEDVETLNKSAIDEKLDITKLSFPAYFRNLQKYVLLNSGAAIGKGVGPLLVSKVQEMLTKEQIEKVTIALPGRHTTANMLFSFAYPDAKHKRFMVFSAIESAVVNSETDLGVIIHENRFTYQQRGLFKQCDLGEHWEQKKHLPVPLGGITIKRSIDPKISKQVSDLIRKSIEYSYAKYPTVSDYVKEHSQTMSEEVMRKHIELYVNDLSYDFSDIGRNAIQEMYEVFKQMNPDARDEAELFLELTTHRSSG